MLLNFLNNFLTWIIVIKNLKYFCKKFYIIFLTFIIINKILIKDIIGIELKTLMSSTQF